LRSGASRLVLASGLLVGAATQSVAEETPVPQMRGLGVFQDRLSLAATAEQRATQPGVGLAEAAAESGHDEGPPEDLRSAYACLIGGSTALAASIAVGGENLTNLIAGGVVVPQNQAVLYIALVGVVFAAFCSISQSLLPIYAHYVDTPERPPARPASARFTHEAALPVTVVPDRVSFQAGVLGRAATSAARRMGASAFASLPRQPAPGDPSPVLVAQER
jgi:hypothetical protein